MKGRPHPPCDPHSPSRQGPCWLCRPRPPDSASPTTSLLCPVRPAPRLQAAAPASLLWDASPPPSCRPHTLAGGGGSPGWGAFSVPSLRSLQGNSPRSCGWPSPVWGTPTITRCPHVRSLAGAGEMVWTEDGRSQHTSKVTESSELCTFPTEQR